MVEIGFHDIHPAVYMWHILGGAVSGILWYLCQPAPVSGFYFLFAIFNMFAIIVYIFGWFSDLTEDSWDWEQDEDDPREIGKWVIVGLLCVLGVSIVVSLYIQEAFSMIWVPMELSPLSLSGSATLAFVIALAGTWFAVVPGEEGLKTIFSSTFKSYEHFWHNVFPFGLQPARLLANSAWAILHIILGQNPVPFFFSVLIAGILWDIFSAKCGTILVSYFVHGLFNSAILIATFITTLGLTLVW